MTGSEALESFCLCDECGDPTDANPDRYYGQEKTLCDGCDRDYVYCRYCDDRTTGDSLCRHLFWSRDWSWYGGCGYDNSEWDWHKESFFTVLDKIGLDAAKVLLISLKQHRYFHQFSGTTFGYDCLTADWYDENGNRRDYGHLFTEGLFEEQEEKMAIGVQWLVSLWAGVGYKDDDDGLVKTPDADDHTAQWIEEWLKRIEPEVTR